jgi:putative ABC transport system substrate-binding protein
MPAMAARLALLLALCAGAAGHLPQPLLAQGRADLPRIAIVEQGGPVENIAIGGIARWEAFLRELEALGHVEGRTVQIERWSASDQTNEGFARVAQAAVATKPDVIVVPGLRMILAARTATTTIPIVGMGGFPADVNPGRPGGNLTGVQGTAGDLDAKAIQLLQEVLAGVDKLAWLGLPDTWNGPIGIGTQAAAKGLGVALDPYFLDSPLAEPNIRQVMRRMAGDKPRGLIVSPPQALVNFAPLVAQLALEASLPAVALQSEYVEAGLLMMYGTNPIELHRRWAGYVDRILDGAQPGDLPIEQPTEFDLVVNLRTAKALGLTLPPTVMIYATKVIE